jgi:hypothetical protein
MTIDAVRPPDVAAAAARAGDDVDAGLAFALEIGRGLTQPGAGATLERWTALALAGAEDLTAARILEAHSDALAILHEAGEAAPDGTWGVFAAEMPGLRLEFRDGHLTGTKPWCSLGDRLDAALITAFVGDERQLFAVDLHEPNVRAEPPEGWVARGLAHVTSTSLHFDGVPARPVGDVGWYLRRPGFAWGGIGVAACWFGGALGLQRSLQTWAAKRSGELPALHLGIVDAAMFGARAALQQAAAEVDAGRAAGPDGALLALRVRAVVAAAAEATLHQVGHALGPAPLSFDDRHARRVADLGLYLRQHHGERDLAALGTATLDADAAAGPAL